MRKPNHREADVLDVRTAYCVGCLKLVPELGKGRFAGGHVTTYGRDKITASWCSRRCEKATKPHGCSNPACYGPWGVRMYGVIAEGIR